MVAIPEPQHTTVREIYRALESGADRDRRGHLGASFLGRECRRALWYAFRWCITEAHDGRILRLFRRGQLEEAQFAADLRAAGCEVITHDEHGRQYSFSDVGGHVGGSMDGAVLGLVEAPKTWHVAEFKTHGEKSFKNLLNDGVQKSKPEHWSQCQLYMHWSGMERAYYLAVNKNTDELYAERIYYDKAAAEALVEKGRAIVTAAEPLERVNEDPAFYLCKFCSARAVCHERRLPEPSCRTCVHATPEIDGEARWSCAYPKAPRPSLTVEEQRAGCDHHVYIPALVPFEFLNGNEELNCVEYVFEGNAISNGTPENGCYTSAELYAAQDSGFKALSIEFLQYLRAQMGGRIESTSPPPAHFDDMDILRERLPLPGEAA